MYSMGCLTAVIVSLVAVCTVWAVCVSFVAVCTFRLSDSCNLAMNIKHVSSS